MVGSCAAVGAAAVWETQPLSFSCDSHDHHTHGDKKNTTKQNKRLIWALVHSGSRTNVQRGLDLARAALDSDQRSAEQDRELKYYAAVALYGSNRLVDARRALAALLRVRCWVWVFGVDARVGVCGLAVSVLCRGACTLLPSCLRSAGSAQGSSVCTRAAHNKTNSNAHSFFPPPALNAAASFQPTTALF